MPKADAHFALDKFQTNLLRSVREFKVGTFARKSHILANDALFARSRMAFSQPEFSNCGASWCIRCGDGNKVANNLGAPHGRFYGWRFNRLRHC